MIWKHTQRLTKDDIAFTKDHPAYKFWRSEPYEHAYDGVAGAFIVHDVASKIIYCFFV